MRTAESYPRAATCHPHVSIPLPDGTRLAARLWLPEDAERRPVPAVLDCIPYRLTDGTLQRDATRYPYLAGHGYAAIRVDLRGSGDSEGVLLDEYLPQEQNDLVAVIAWAARQPWCTGAVGMTGISWGGFNSLQVAARRPPELKAIITICSTDDRYADDVHYKGGCVLALDMAPWGATMLNYQALPPHPHVVGDRWLDMWRQRLEANFDWTETWLSHQRRDGYWRQGSVCEDYSAIECPVYAVGGWTDGYTDSVMRLLGGLAGPRKGLIGPWSHLWPQEGAPGPAIGFLQEALRWWDYWLRGIETGIMDEPMLRVWMEEYIAPAPTIAEHPGRWVAEETWPSARIERREWALSGVDGSACGGALIACDAAASEADRPAGQTDALTAAGSGPAVDALRPERRPCAGDVVRPDSWELDALAVYEPASAPSDVMTPAGGVPTVADVMAQAVPAGPPVDAFSAAFPPGDHPASRAGEKPLSVCSPQLTGLDAGAWCMEGQPGDWPADQRAEDGRSLVFDGAPLSERLEILGHAEVRLALASDRPLAQLAVRLCDVAPDGASKLVTRTVLNLTHREGHESPAPLDPNRRYRVTIRLDSIAHAFPAGHRMRIGISTSYWPWIWPSPEAATITVFAGPDSLLRLPVRPPCGADASLAPFAEPEQSAPLELSSQGGSPGGRALMRDLRTDTATLRFDYIDSPLLQIADPRPPTSEEPPQEAASLTNVRISSRDTVSSIYTITEGDPLSARVDCSCSCDLESDAGLTVHIETATFMTADAENFYLSSEQRVTQNGQEVHEHTSRRTVPRDLV